MAANGVPVTTMHLPTVIAAAGALTLTLLMLYWMLILQDKWTIETTNHER